ncbi:MAG: NAD(P)H-hydrate dehydratase [Cyclobacteriaceae bacterium]|nr:NAD(P)H-hydrate dehydratase [Cyclobacteriaceae bacterium]
MINLFSSEQTKAWDAHTIRESGITSYELMQQASRAFTQWFVERFDASNKVLIVCGTGNNGGDGLCIGRLLHEWNYPVQIALVRGPAPTPDFEKSLAELPSQLNSIELTAANQIHVEKKLIIIDAIFGSGLSRPLGGLHAQVVHALNQAQAVRIAVDIPSGLQMDAHSEGEIFHAHYTVTFQAPKLAFLLPENYQHVGEWHVVDIGLSKSFAKATHAPYCYLQHKTVAQLLKPRARFSHKGNYGHALLVAGSFGKMGAAVLAARAVLRAGCGLLTVHVPGHGNTILQTTVPEAMTTQDQSPDFFSDREVEDFFTAVGIGPGLGQAAETRTGFKRILARCSKPLVLDADALNLLALQPDLRAHIPPESILTPHPGEFRRLAGEWKNDFDKVEKLRTLASEWKVVIILKGAHSAIAVPDGPVIFNSTGNPGMATGGSGDVLTGVLLGLLAQGYTAKNAAIIGTYVHGLAGDLAAREKGEVSLIAGDLIENLPAAFKKIS